jgi:beta-mannosidase
MYTFENFVAATRAALYLRMQLVQAEAMMFAYVSWRRLRRGQGREECADALCWQLNDCWPCLQLIHWRLLFASKTGIVYN